MATLLVDDLGLEIRYRNFEYGWVVYDILPLWRGKPILNDAILKRHNDYWGGRAYGGVHANEHRGCAVLPLLRRVLETNKADYCETLDPDILLAIYPNRYFPFLPSTMKLLWEAPHLTEARAKREAERDPLGRLPEDVIEVILSVDTYNFSDCDAYSGQGVCFRLAPRRHALEEFYQQLRAEYVIFKEKHGVDKFNSTELGSDYEEWF
jgi:hypothetical protein